MHAPADCAQPAGGPDPAAAEADGKLQSPPDRHVWHLGQVRFFIFLTKSCYKVPEERVTRGLLDTSDWIQREISATVSQNVSALRKQSGSRCVGIQRWLFSLRNVIYLW